MTNPLAKNEPAADRSDNLLSAAALEFADVLGNALARQWIQEQTNATDSARPQPSSPAPRQTSSPDSVRDFSEPALRRREGST